MTIGSSKGAFYKDEFHEAAADWIKPEETDDGMVKTPPQVQQNKQLENVELQELGGIEVGYKEDDNWGVKLYGVNPMLDLENQVSGGGGGVVPFRNKPSNDNAKDSNGADMTRIGQLAKKLGEAENGKGSWDRIGGGGQEHYYRDARRALKNDTKEDPAAYNPKDPTMIGSKEQDAAIDKAWGRMVQKNQDELPMLQLQARKFQAEINGEKLTEFESSRFDKLKSAWKEKYNSNWDPNDNVLGP